MRLRLYSIAAVLLLISASAWAERADPVLPKPDPDGYWRLVTDDPSTTTSNCIGKNTSPECTLETDVAAFFRADNELLTIATGVKRRPWEQRLTKTKDTAIKYRIVSSGRVGKNPPKYDDMHQEFSWREGDVWVIVDERNCLHDQCEEPIPATAQYFLERYAFHKFGKRWLTIYFGDLHWEQ